MQLQFQRTIMNLMKLNKETNYPFVGCDNEKGEVLINVKYSSLDYECCATVSGSISTRVTPKPVKLTSDIAERMASSNDDASR